MERCRYRRPASSPHLGVFATSHEAYPRHDGVDVEAEKFFCLQVRRNHRLPSCTSWTGCLGLLQSGPTPLPHQRLTCGTLPSWVSQLGDVLGHQGLEGVRFERCTISDHNKMWWGLNCCMLCEEYCVGLERESAGGDDAARIKSHREAIREAAVAAQNGVVVCSTLVLAVGRKAF